MSRYLLALVVATAVVPAAGVKTLTGISECDSQASAARGLFANAEVEPSLAADPSGRRLVVAYQQDRSSRGGAGGIDVANSRDGGTTWSRPRRVFGSCDPAAAPVSDPWVSIGPDGRTYATGLDVGAGVVAATSLDGGASWQPTGLLAARSAGHELDKPTIAADPTRRGTAYAVWEDYPVSPGRPPNVADAVLSVTRDGGSSWSRPRTILPHAGGFGPMTTNVVVDPIDGVLYAFSLWIRGPEPAPGEASRLLLQRSADAGRTWSSPRTIGSVRAAWGALRDPSSGRQIRPSVPSFAVAPASHRLYAVWTDDRFSASPAIDHVVVTSSADRGRHWSTPERVDPPSSELGAIPSVAVAPDGTLGVTYFSVGSDSSVGYWLARSRNGRPFARRRIGQPFDLRNAPLLAGDPDHLVPGGYFLGDYMSVIGVPGGFASAFVTANASRGNPTDVRFARVR